jgi:hypothetical protein
VDLDETERFCLHSDLDMLRKAQIAKVVGRRLLQRILEVGWLAPTQSDERGIFFDPRSVHRARSRVQNEGLRLNGNVYRRSVRPAEKVKRTGAEIVINADEL